LKVIFNRIFLYDKELASIGIKPAIGHGKRSSVIIQVIAEFIFKRFFPDALASGAVSQRVTTLNHKIINYPMEG